MAFTPISTTTSLKAGFRPVDIGSIPVQKTPQISDIRNNALGALKIAGKETVEAAKGGLSQIGQGVARTFRLNGESEMFPGEGKTQIASGIINTLGSPLAPIINRTIGPAISPALQGLDEGALKIGGIPLQRALRYAGNAANVGSLAIAPKVPGRVRGLFEDLTARSEAQIESSILKNYETGVKPLINAKRTPNQLDRYRDDVVKAVTTISANKDSLRFQDEGGDFVTGRKPQTLQEFSDSISQTKKRIFSNYNAVAKDAKDAGVQVSMDGIAPELDAVIKNEALAFVAPKAIEYAKDVKARMAQNLLPGGEPMGYKKFDPVMAQEIIGHYNNTLNAYYRNPSYDLASQAAIDALIANNFRSALDKSINGATGKQYAALKEQYGALKAIEQDVLKSTLRDARKNTKGLVDFSDIFTGGQAVAGIMSLNPSLIGSAVASKAMAEYIKFLNNPNRAVERLFNEADALQSLKPSSQVQASPTPTARSVPNRNAMQSTLPEGGAIINSNGKQNTSVAPTSGGDSLLGRAGTYLKGVIEHVRTNKEPGFVRVPFTKPATAALKGAQSYAKEATAFLKKTEQLGGQQQLIYLMSQADDMLNLGFPLPENLTKTSLRKGLRDTLTPILGVDTFAWSDAKLSQFIAAVRKKIESLDDKFDSEKKVNNPFGANIRGVSVPKTDMSGGFTGDYLYHGTGEVNLDSIAKDGLKPSMRGTLSLSKDEGYSRSFAEGAKFPPQKGSGVMFRVKADFIKDKTVSSNKPRPASDDLNEILTKETIPPEHIEIFKDGEWQPLKPSPSIPKELEGLAAEARKYKTAEEFINAETVAGKSPAFFDGETLKKGYETGRPLLLRELYGPLTPSDYRTPDLANVVIRFSKTEKGLMSPLAHVEFEAGGKNTTIVVNTKFPFRNDVPAEIQKALVEEVEHIKTILGNPDFMQKGALDTTAKGYSGYIKDTREIAGKANATKRISATLTDFFNKVKGNK